MKQYRPARNNLVSCLSIASALVLAMGLGAGAAHAQDSGAPPPNPSNWVREQQVLVLPQVVSPDSDSSSYAGTADDDNSPYAGTADNANAPEDGTADASSSGPVVVNPAAPAAGTALADGSPDADAPQAGTLQDYENQTAVAAAYGPAVVLIPSAMMAAPAYRPYYPYYSYPRVTTPFGYGNAVGHSPYIIPGASPYSPYPMNNLRPTYPSFAPAPAAFSSAGPWGPRAAFGAPMASHPFVSPMMAAPRASFGFRVR